MKTPSYYADAAQQYIDQLRAMRETIPNFAIPASTREGQRLATVSSLPPEFVELVAVQMKLTAGLTPGATDADTVRELMNYAGAFDPLADEFEAMAYFLRHSIAAARARAGQATLMAYEVAKRLAKTPEYADLSETVADMTRTLGYRQRAAKAKATLRRKAEAAAAAAAAAAASKEGTEK
jgi:hypothetical protein